MKGIVIGMMCLALAVAIALTGVLVLGLNGVLPTFGGLELFNMKLVNRQRFGASQFSEILLDYSSEKIILLPGGDEVILEEYMSRNDPDMYANISENGGTLDIRHGRRPRFSLFSIWNAEIRLYLPASWAGSLKVKTGSGGIAAEGSLNLEDFEGRSGSGSIRLQELAVKNNIALKAASGSISADVLTADGDVAIDTGSGSIRPGQVQANGNFSAEAGSGSVRVESASAKRVRGKAGSGAVSFEVLNGQFDLQSNSGGVQIEDGAGFGSASAGSGSVRVTLGEVTGDVRLETNSGGCRLRVPSATAFNLQAHTNSGGLHLPDGGNLNYGRGDHEANGSYGANPQYSVSLQAGSGSVTLEWD